MSDSELSETPPSDDVLEQELRQIVRDTYSKGNLNDLTVKRVRLAAEKSLGLPEGFYKSDAWKTRSKDLIEGEVQAQDKAPAKQAAPSKPSPSKPAAKRKSPDESREVKRQKPNDKPKKPKAPAKVESSSELSDADSEPAKPVAIGKTEKQADAAQEQSESEMSDVIDEGPKPAKKRMRKEGGSGKASKPAKSPKAKKQSKTKPAADANPDAEEVKKLQGWLAKCGIRKVWGKELKPYETPRAKIDHLKSLLEDVGMTGRYSIEKAQRIREMRELQADLEAVQEGAKYWGKSDEEEDRGARRKRLARGSRPQRRIVDSGDEVEAQSSGAEKPKPAAVQASDDDSD